MATPFTAPIWLVLGILLLIRPSVHTIWRGCTIGHLVAFGFIALFGLFGWIDFYRQRETGVMGLMLREMSTMFWIGSTLSALTFVTLKLSASASTPSARRWLSVGLQIVVVCVAVAYTAYYLFFRDRMYGAS